MRTLVEIAQELTSASDEVDEIRRRLDIDETYAYERDDIDKALRKIAADLESLGQRTGEIGRGYDA